MSRSTQLLKELTTGVHLVILGGFTAVRNPDGTLKESETGEKLIQVRFTDGFNKHFDKQYWVKGKREFEFNKMMTCAGIDRSKPMPLKEMEATATGKRLWISIQEVHTIDGTEEVGVVDYQIFDYDPCLNPEKKPTKKGDPENNKGVAGGDFVTCKTTNQSYVEFVDGKFSTKDESIANQMNKIWEATKPEEASKSLEDLSQIAEEVLAPTQIDKKEIIAKAKEMIAKVESKVKEPKKGDDTINWDDYK